MAQAITPCKECGCICRYCNDHGGLHLHVEIENLKQRLLERENHIVKMETNFLKEADKFPNGEVAAISEELLTWQDKYSRLYEAHKRVQKVNQNLEDKLLRIVDKCETEKSALTSEVSQLTRRLVDEKFSVSRLQEENERYRNDVNLAIQLLQCKPSNFVSQKYDTLPADLQLKVRTYLTNKRRQTDGNGNSQPKPEVKTIKVPIPTYPPTAMVYSINKGPLDRECEEKVNNISNSVDIVSAAIMAKVLEEREKERSQAKHCETCACLSGRGSQDKSSQTGEPVITRTTANGKQGRSVMSIKSPAREGVWAENKEALLAPPAAVSEAILVDLSSPDDSPSNSLGSECSSLSWPSSQRPEPADLISFPSPAASPAPNRGPRHCSVRVQLGTNNILLDNIHSFTPVLYKGKNDAPVHANRSRSTSSSSDEPARKTLFRTETEI